MWCSAQADADAGMSIDAQRKLLHDLFSAESSAGHAQSVESAALRLDDLIVFNRSHLKLFLSDSRFRDLFTFVNAYAPEWIAPAEISARFGIPEPELSRMIEQLSDLGILVLRGEDGRCRTPKSNFYFPDDEDFFALRNANFAQNVETLMSRLTYLELQEKAAHRSLVTRELTPEQASWVSTELERLMSQVVALPETSKPDRVYSVCTLLGERFRRAGPALPLGLTRVVEIADKPAQTLSQNQAQS